MRKDSLRTRSSGHPRGVSVGLTNDSPAQDSCSVFVVGLTAPLAQAEVFSSTNTPEGFGGTLEPTELTRSILVPFGGTVEDLNVMVDASHAYVRDVIITLESPAGTEVVLLDRFPVGGAGASFNDSVFDDETDEEFPTNGASVRGLAQPDSPLSTFDGEDMFGWWRLTIEDASAGEDGTLWGFHLQFNGECGLTSEDGRVVLECDGQRTEVDDASCTITERSDGSTLIECADGNEAVIPATDGDSSGCSVSEEDNGGATIECPDGSIVTIPGPNSDDSEMEPTGMGGDSNGETDGISCTVTNDENGAAIIECPDGTSATVEPGTSSDDGGCSYSVRRAKAGSPWAWMILLAGGIGFGLRRRRGARAGDCENQRN